MSVFDHPIVCVDTETDGGNYKHGHIIEIAVIRIERGEIVDQFSTLLDPNISVPSFISRLTGITTSDLVGKPQFDDIAERLLEIMDGAIFVAHNVRFDYSFIKEEFRRIGINFSPKLLCTVRLSRALYPEVKGHKLSDLIARHDFTYSARHRAYDDAHVLWQFLQLADSTFSEQVIAQVVARQLALPSVPKHLDEHMIRSLPHAAGVYIFDDIDGNPLYIGKSIDIKKRVMSHFTRDTAEYKEFKIAQQVHTIRHEVTGGELSALLRESYLIKQLQPLYNRRLRRMKEFIVAQSVKNEHGYAELVFRQLSDIAEDESDSIMGVYQNKTKAKAAVLSAIRTFSLCPKLCGLEKSNGSCFSYQLKRCHGACIQKENPTHYNNRLVLAFERTKVPSWPYDSAVMVSESSALQEGLIVDNWRITGRFEAKKGEVITEPYDAVFDIDAYKILKAYMLQPESTLSIKPFVGV